MPQHSTLARLLQVSVALQLAAAVGWCAWRWHTAPLQAVLGAGLIVFAAPLVLGIELAMVWRVARTDAGVPQPRAVQLLRAWASETRHFFRTFCWRQPFCWRAVSDHVEPSAAGRTGVVLVHGFMCNRGFWTPWLRALQQHDVPCMAVNLEPVYGPIDDYVPTIGAAVQRMRDVTGRPPLLVAHSMGGLAARAWCRAGGAAGQLAHLVTIGSPHGGTWLARFSSRPNGRQMRLQNAWLRTLAGHEQHHALPTSTCWYSNCDNVVFPASTATLPGADNRFIAGEAHVALAFRPEVLAHCLELVRAADARRQGESVTGTAAENV
jgi:pimeloyl-ACP methyl ester carboxylesterase